MGDFIMNDNNTEATDITEELRSEFEATRSAFHELLLSIPEDVAR